MTHRTATAETIHHALDAHRWIAADEIRTNLRDNTPHIVSDTAAGHYWQLPHGAGSAEIVLCEAVMAHLDDIAPRNVERITDGWWTASVYYRSGSYGVHLLGVAWSYWSDSDCSDVVQTVLDDIGEVWADVRCANLCAGVISSTDTRVNSGGAIGIPS